MLEKHRHYRRRRQSVMLAHDKHTSNASYAEAEEQRSSRRALVGSTDQGKMQVAHRARSAAPFSGPLFERTPILDSYHEYHDFKERRR